MRFIADRRFYGLAARQWNTFRSTKYAPAVSCVCPQAHNVSTACMNVHTLAGPVQADAVVDFASGPATTMLPHGACVLLAGGRSSNTFNAVRSHTAGREAQHDVDPLKLGARTHVDDRLGGTCGMVNCAHGKHYNLSFLVLVPRCCDVCL
jgi:hypothetical protein